MAQGPPRPKKNSDGQDKQPSANPQGGAAPAPQGAAPGPPNTAPQISPGMQMVSGIAGQLQGAPGVPNTPGAGVPEGLQSFPQDAAALMEMMRSGYAPGADNFAHAQAQNAHAIARAQEAAAASQANDSMMQEANAKQLAELLQQLMMGGNLPHPADVAMQTAAGPQLPGGLTTPGQAPSMPPGPGAPGQGPPLPPQ